ncbi:MAG: four-carbon acid sugar kinase family protein [Thermoguttaceae bacterium]
MIAVISDDFTGAAEIGGIGLRNGLKVVIETGHIQSCNADLLVIAADTRSLPAAEASKLIERITYRLLELKPACVYKKIDSVLRGNIADEIFAMMKVAGKKRGVIVAANPVFKRIIKDGVYYIDNVPLKETSFSADPEWPARSSSVLEIIGKKEFVCNCKHDDILPEEGLIIGDVEDNEDLNRWANHVDAQTLPVGASGFFHALLKKHGALPGKSLSSVLPFAEKRLYLLGSAFPKAPEFFDKLGKYGFYSSNIPDEIYCNRNYDPMHLEAWSDDVVKGLNIRQKVVVSIVHDAIDESDIALRIRETIGKLVNKVMEKTELNEILIEGGGTTSAVLQSLGINSLIPFEELATGVIRMKIEEKANLCLTTKPGSYAWPESVWFPVSD